MPRSSNDQKSDAHNVGSREWQDNQDNRSRQLNSEDEQYDKSRAGAQEQEQQQHQQRQQDE
jgi:hypothetical protein